MFYFLCKTSFLPGRHIVITASQSHKLLRILQNESLVFKSSSTLRFVFTTSNQQSFTVSYLINKFGLSPKRASWASTYFHFETPEKPDSVIAFLEKHGFSKTQVTNIIRRQPRVLASDTGKTLLPKIEFLYSIGFSRPDLTNLFTDYPSLFATSLEKQIIPSFNMLTNLFQSDDKAIKVTKRYAGILSYNPDLYLFPNMDILRRSGVPESNIVTMLVRQPRALLFNSVRLKEAVEEVKRMGVDSSRKKFVRAAFALRSISKSTLEKKFDIYRRWGWSDQEIREAFQKHPECLTVSEDKIMAIMDFLVNKMGFDSALVAKQSSILCRSLEKRIVPRGLFAQELLSRGLINNDLKLSVLFDTSEKVFLRRFVNCYANKAPELLKLYERKPYEQKLNTSEKLKSEVI